MINKRRAQENVGSEAKALPGPKHNIHSPVMLINSDKDYNNTDSHVPSKKYCVSVWAASCE